MGVHNHHHVVPSPIMMIPSGAIFTAPQVANYTGGGERRRDGGGGGGPNGNQAWSQNHRHHHHHQQV